MASPHLLLLLLHSSCLASPPSAREMYDSMSMMVSGQPYPSVWWEEREACMSTLSPSLTHTMDMAWAGMRDFWNTRGAEKDTWHECNSQSMTPLSSLGWFENNCTLQQPVEMDIWEPCTYASNLAYDRLMVEMCLQQDWTFDTYTVSKIAEAFSVNTFGSAFMHGSNTHLGAAQDTRSNDIFPFIIYQAGVSNIPYDPVIHDLSQDPRPVSAEGMIDIFHDMYNNKPVYEWNAITSDIDVPTIQRTFAGIVGYILTLLFDPVIVDQVSSVALDLLGVSQEDRDFMMIYFLPAIREASSHHYLGLRDRITLGTNSLATLLKLFYAFVWQEYYIDFGGANLTPEANAIGAALLPHINEYANNLTSWTLHVGDVQTGEAYPGWQNCNPVIPHAKWHVETAASLSDVARLMDSVLKIMQD